MSKISLTDRQEMVAGIRQAAEQGGNRLPSLQERLSSVGMRMKAIEGDGNCQFRSLAFNLFGGQAHHAVIRQAAVAHLKKHRDFFGALFENNADFKAYLREMARNHTWGDELTLRAVVDAYACEAHVITSEPANWYLVYQPESKDEIDCKVAVCPKGLPLPQ